jgi:hypothetical protein
MTLALKQIDRIAQLCDFVEHPGIRKAIDDSVPVTMPQDLGSLGFDVHLWVGFAIVGLWAALDAFAERSGFPPSTCAVCGGRNCLSSRLTTIGSMSPPDRQTLEELEDLRHLFAHNYAGQADAVYFRRPRHVLSSGKSVTLSSGAAFDGTNLTLNQTHLRRYAEQSQQIVRTLS